MSFFLSFPSDYQRAGEKKKKEKKGEKRKLNPRLPSPLLGTNAINYYAPQIFTNLGLTGTAPSLFATGIYGVLKMVGCALFLLLAADSLGRRRSLLWTSIAQGLCMFYIGAYIRVAPPEKGVPVPPAGYVAIVAIYLFAVFFQFGWVSLFFLGGGSLLLIDVLADTFFSSSRDRFAGFTSRRFLLLDCVHSTSLLQQRHSGCSISSWPEQLRR